MKLICPVCHTPLESSEHSVCCVNRHSFDYARSGYLNLLNRPAPGAGDNAGMVQARTAFLSTGAYAFLKEEIIKILKEEPVEVFVDLGCGEGTYTSGCPGKEKYGFDLSKQAINYAAKHDKTTQYAVASIFHLPLENACADAVLTCFAPVAGEEIARITVPGGRFVLVSPGEMHLYEMKQVLYDAPYKNELSSPSIAGMEKEKELQIEQKFSVDHSSLQSLIQMTPYAYHTGKEGLARLSQVEQMELTASFQLQVFRSHY